MKMTSRAVIFTAIITIGAFMSVLYTSCTKDTKKPSVDHCASITCQNGGTCYKGYCTCPVGFEDERCQTRSNIRFIGDWEITDNIIGSSLPSNRGKQNTYTVNISAEGNTNTVLRMKGFLGDPNYGDLLLHLGFAPALKKINGQIIEVDSISLPTDYIFQRNQAIKNTYIIVQKGTGSVNGIGTTINGTCYMIYQDTTGPVIDTLKFTGIYK